MLFQRFFKPELVMNRNQPLTFTDKN
jgi:hypothetical protein